MPPYRKVAYGIWRACERFGILPPEMKGSWDELGPWSQCLLLEYDRIRQYEETEELEILAKSRVSL